MNGIKLSSNMETITIEGNEQVYPCRCGETHRGMYAFEDWNHHNCFHGDPLVAIDADEGYYMCGGCGATFHLAYEGMCCPECGEHWRKKSGDEPTAIHECGNGHTWEGPARPFAGAA